MKLLLSCCFLIVFAASAQQPFQPNSVGWCNDPEFRELIAQRGYRMVYNWIESYGKGEWIVPVLNRDSTLIFLNVMGTEFTTEKAVKEDYIRKRPQKERNTVVEQMLFREDRLHSYTDPQTRLKGFARGYEHVTEAVYKDIWRFENGHFRVEKGELVGVLDTTLKEIVPFRFSSLYYRENLNLYIAENYDAGQTFLYDMEGGVVTGTFYEKVVEFGDHMLILQRADEDGESTGLFDTKTGKFILECVHAKIYQPFGMRGYAKLYRKDPEHEAEQKRDYYGKLLGYNEEDLLVGIIDSSGQIVLEPQYDEVIYCAVSHYFSVSRQGKWGLTDLNGKEVLPIVYERLYSLDNRSIMGMTEFPKDLFAVKVDGKHGVMNVKKEMVIPAVYDELTVTYFGLLVKKDGLTGMISAAGETMVAFRKMEVRDVARGRIECIIDGKRCELDFYGHQLCRK